jgi:diphthine methyl ester acylhydrolase
VFTLAQPAAVLDLHFQPHDGRNDRFAVALSTGELCVFQLSPESLPPVQLKKRLRISDIPGDVLFLSCVWHPDATDLIAVTTSTYEVYLISLSKDGATQTERAEPVITHELEAWTAAFSSIVMPFQDLPRSSKEDRIFTLYSGGDDSMLRYISCQTSLDPDGRITGFELPYPGTQFAAQQAGVTAILPLPFLLPDGSEIVITGSYDDTISVLGIQPLHRSQGLRRVKRLADANLGGGVWRLKLVDMTDDEATSSGQKACKFKILASCMHAGVRLIVVSVDEESTWDIQVITRFEEHKSMNYGSDFQPGRILGPRRYVSTSFYDKLMCLWTPGM